MTETQMIGDFINRPPPDRNLYEHDRRRDLAHTFYIAAMRGDAEGEKHALEMIKKNHDMSKRLEKNYSPEVSYE